MPASSCCRRTGRIRCRAAIASALSPRFWKPAACAHDRAGNDGSAGYPRRTDRRAGTLREWRCLVGQSRQCAELRRAARPRLSTRRAGVRSKSTLLLAASITRLSMSSRSAAHRLRANARELAEAGIELKSPSWQNRSRCSIPRSQAINEIAYVMFRDREPDGAVRTCTTLKPGRVDRSPCGTGSSANLAVFMPVAKSRSGTGAYPGRSSAVSFWLKRSAKPPLAGTRQFCHVSLDKPGSTVPRNCVSMKAIPSHQASPFRIPGVLRSRSLSDGERR